MKDSLKFAAVCVIAAPLAGCLGASAGEPKYNQITVNHPQERNMFDSIYKPTGPNTDVTYEDSGHRYHTQERNRGVTLISQDENLGHGSIVIGSDDGTPASISGKDKLMKQVYTTELQSYIENGELKVREVKIPTGHTEEVATDR